MRMMSEFKTFVVRGNVVDLAIGLVIGAAFTKIVSSLVANIVTPPLGLLIGGVDFSKLKIPLTQAVGDTPGVSIDYGIFLQATFDFIIIAFAVFMVIRGINSLKRKEADAPSAPPAPSREEVLLTEIRDLLRQSHRNTNDVADK